MIEVKEDIVYLNGEEIGWISRDRKHIHINPEYEIILTNCKSINATDISFKLKEERKNA